MSLAPSEKKRKKIRIDLLLLEQGLAPSRERAQAWIMAGQVIANERRVLKASECFDPSATQIRLTGKDHPYVGRGGVKLQGALEGFGLDPKGATCLDVGASTGGFTDCLLQRGARKVYAFDCGTNQLDFRLRQDPRVVVRENFNVRQLSPEDLPEKIDWIVIDVSFISLTKVLPPLLQAVPGPWQLLMLVKPQFEAGPESIEKGGIVRDPKIQQRALEEIRKFSENLGLKIEGQAPCVITGEKGNQEFFLWASQGLEKT